MADMEVMERIDRTTCAPTALTDMEALYEGTFPAVAAWVKSMGGTFEDARDMFHDALVIYMEKRVAITVSAAVYLVGIVKHLWIRKFRRDQRFVKLNDMEAALVLPPDHVITVDDNRLLALLERTGKRCLDLLRSFYFGEQSLREISRKLDYTSEHSAAVQKYKCIEKMRETVKQNSTTYEDFLE